MATTAFGLLLLAALVALGRPAAPLTARDLPSAAVRGAVVLIRLSDRRTERLRDRADPARDRPVRAEGVDEPHRSPRGPVRPRT